MSYLQTFLEGYWGYANYFFNEILHPSWHNYFYWLLGLSLVVWTLEINFPWRKNQCAIRQDGVNFGITLSIWDYIFGQNYVPKVDGTIKLGFDDIANFPKTFKKQLFYPWNKK